MAGSFAEPISICVARRNLARIARRDILVQASDTPVLTATIYQRDTDAAPLDITGASFVMSLYRERDENRWGWWDWDYGAYWRDFLPYVVIQFPGVVVDAAAGRVDFRPVGNPQQWIVGRYAFEITMSYAPTVNATVPGDFSPLDFSGTDFNTGTQPAPVNYGSGNFTILVGVCDLRPGAVIPLTGEFSPTDFSSTDYNTGPPPV